MGALMTTVQNRAKNRMLAVNDRGYVIGEQHHRAKLSDHEVDLVLALLADGMSERQVAEKMEIGRRTVRDIKAGRIRSQTPVAWRGADKRQAPW